MHGINIPVCAAMLAPLTKVAISATGLPHSTGPASSSRCSAWQGLTYGLIEGGAYGFGSGLKTSLTIAAVLLLAIVVISLRIRNTDHR